MEKTLGEKIKKSVDNYFDTRSVGGHIPIDRFQEWDEYTMRCKKHGISVSYEGFFDMLTTSNKINKILFPLAEKYGYDPVEFKNEIIDIMLSTLDIVGSTDIFERIENIHDEVLLQVNEKFKSTLDNTMEHRSTKEYKKVI
ncbi:MAG: hypothetical protein IMZ64_08495 [Bacteroidetes bacterium]|nr:hypothetical protein [Bacteroidota bacterium]